MTETPALPVRRPVWPVIVAGAAALLLAGLLDLMLGSQVVGLPTIFNPQGEEEARAARIVWLYRFPRTVLAALVGAVLALAGMLFQALLRNPLASPFTLGVAGGGTLGAYTVIILLESTAWAAAFTAGLGPWEIVGLRAVGAFTGVLLTIALAFAIARVAGGTHTVTLLLAGVALNYVCAAGVMLLQLMADFTQAMRMIRWSMGGLDNVGWAMLRPTVALVAIGFLITLPALRHLDVLSIDDRTARLLGVPVRRVRLQIILGTAIMVGACLAVAGPIGFIGLMVPHLCRLIVGPGHRLLLPASVFTGAALLALADTMGRSIPSLLLQRAGDIPVGVLTAACGGPFFLAILLGFGRRGALSGQGE